MTLLSQKLWIFHPPFHPLTMKMLISTTNLLVLNVNLIVLFLKAKYKELKVQEPSYSKGLFCYHTLTFARQILIKQLYYYHTTEYSITRQGFYHQSDIPSLTLPNFQVKK